MKTQEEYAREIEGIILRDVESCQGDWFNIDKEIFMQPENENKAFILGTRKTGCDLIILGYSIVSKRPGRTVVNILKGINKREMKILALDIFTKKCR